MQSIIGTSLAYFCWKQSGEKDLGDDLLIAVDILTIITLYEMENFSAFNLERDSFQWCTTIYLHHAWNTNHTKNIDLCTRSLKLNYNFWKI